MLLIIKENLFVYLKVYYSGFIGYSSRSINIVEKKNYAIAVKLNSKLWNNYFNCAYDLIMNENIYIIIKISFH